MVVDRAQYLQQLHAQFGLADQDVVRLVEQATGNSVVGSDRLIRGDEAEVHRVRLDGGAVVYVRASLPGTTPDKAYGEAWAMGRARDAGVPVPTVIGTETLETADGPRTAMVISAAPGQPLAHLLPTLSAAQRWSAMEEMGRVLGTLHSITMPGPGRPDAQGAWSDPDEHWRRQIATCLSDCRHLSSAGLSQAETDRVAAILGQPPDDQHEPAVLCHGDLSPVHVFVDPQLRVVGVIDWGGWYAGSPLYELAGMALGNSTTDFSAIMSGHGPAARSSPPAMKWHAIAHATRAVAWLVTSGQTAELERPTAALRDALADGLLQQVDHARSWTSARR